MAKAKEVKETKKCKKCMEEINKKAKRCPKCGANLGMPGWLKFLIVIGVVIVMCVSCMSSCADSVSDSVNDLTNSYKDINGKTSFKVGESFQNKYLKVTVTDVNTNWKGYDSYGKPGEGKKIVRVAINAENIGEESEDISSLYFKLYADDVVVNQYIWADDGTEFGGTISSGKKTAGALYYEVPSNAKTLQLEYAPYVLDSSIVVHFAIN